MHRRVVRDGLPVVDHVIVASSGVWIVAREHVACARVSVRRRHLTGAPVLRIGGRDRSALLATFDDQITALRATLFDFLDAPVQAALVLPGAEFPLLRTLAAGDHLVLRPAQLLTHLEARGRCAARAREIAEALDAASRRRRSLTTSAAPHADAAATAAPERGRRARADPRSASPRPRHPGTAPARSSGDASASSCADHAAGRSSQASSTPSTPRRRRRSGRRRC